MSDTAQILGISVGSRLLIDGVECIVTRVDRDGITTRPLTDAD